MKKIINGKKYDTDTAEEIGYWNNGLLYSDFCYIEETLYKKKTGEFFLYGIGGVMTKYAERTSGGFSSTGKAIIPLTEDKAKKWAEDYLTVGEYEEIFGEMKTYKFCVMLCGGYCGGYIHVNADDEDEAYDKAIEDI